MEFRVLGPLEVVGADGVVPLGSAQQRLVLALLLVHGSHPVSVDRLIDQIWGERPPPSAAHAVQVYVSGIRKLLRAGPVAIPVSTSPSGYAIDVDPEQVDARRFERLVDEAQQVLADEPRHARRLFEEALGLWRGPPLAEFEQSELAMSEADRLEESHTLALEGVVEARLGCGEHAEVIGQITALVAAHPLRERPRRLLMLALYRCGRHAEALAAYRDACEALDEIGLQPGPELRQLEQAILRHDPSLTASGYRAEVRGDARSGDARKGDAWSADSGSPPLTLSGPVGPAPAAAPRLTNLPADPRPLVGRDAELCRLRALLSDSARLVTLVGVGGVGKTRLALAAGRQMLNGLPGGAFVVALAAVGEPAGVLPAVAQAIGVHDVEGDPLGPVVECIGERPMLLILDNFEQIPAAGPLAGELVAAAPSLRIIVTSQAPLRIGAETVVRVDALAPTAAVDLFIERAAAIAPGVAVSEADRSVVAEICERVGRLPLAVELAAARMRVLAPEDLLVRLEASSAVLRSAARDAPKRQRSLHATLEWTHSALTEEQRTLFRRLGVFAGPVPVDAIEAVAVQPASEHDSDDTLDALGGLIDFSLVHRDQSPIHGLRFSMPQALRDFAREKLTAASEQDAVNRRHAQHVSNLGDGIRFWFGASANERGCVLALDSEFSPALGWAKDRDRDLHRRLVAGLGMMLIRRGRVREANDHLALALEGDRAPSNPVEAWLGNVRAYGLLFAGRTDEAWAALEPVIAFDRERGDERELALVLQTAGWLHIEQNELPAAIAAAEESLELVRRIGEPRLLPRALLLRVQTLIDAGRLDDAERLLNQAASEVKESTSDFDLGIATLRGDVALARDDHARALDHYATSLALAERLGEAMQMINDGLYIAWLLNLRGQTEAALEADALVAAIARDAGRDTNAVGVNAAEALAAVREAAGRVGTEAAGRAAAIAPADRVARILGLTQAAR